MGMKWIGRLTSTWVALETKSGDEVVDGIALKAARSNYNASVGEVFSQSSLFIYFNIYVLFSYYVLLKLTIFTSPFFQKSRLLGQPRFFLI